MIARHCCCCRWCRSSTISDYGQSLVGTQSFSLPGWHMPTSLFIIKNHTWAHRQWDNRRELLVQAEKGGLGGMVAGVSRQGWRSGKKQTTTKMAAQKMGLGHKCGNERRLCRGLGLLPAWEFPEPSLTVVLGFVRVCVDLCNVRTHTGTPHLTIHWHHLAW